MHISKAIKHLKWKFENVWNITEDDIKAYKAIVNYKEHNESVNLSKNESLAKLYIFVLRRLIEKEERTIYDLEIHKKINIILEDSVYNHCLKLMNQLNNSNMYFRIKENVKDIEMPFNHVHPSNYIDCISDEVDNNKKLELVLKYQEEKKKYKERLHNFIDNNSDKLTNHIFNENDIIKFIEQQISYIIDKYEK